MIVSGLAVALWIAAMRLDNLVVLPYDFLLTVAGLYAAFEANAFKHAIGYITAVITAWLITYGYVVQAWGDNEASYIIAGLFAPVVYLISAHKEKTCHLKDCIEEKKWKY